MRKAAASILLAVILVTACGPDNHLTFGEVVEMQYDDPDSWWTTVCVSYGKYGCQASVPIEQHDPAHYKVKITGRWKGKQRTETHEISAGLWYGTKVGDEIDLVKAQAGGN